MEASPIVEAGIVTYRKVRFNGSFVNTGIYGNVADPGDVVDKAWNALGLQCMFFWSQKKCS
jgi:hypothetical protein